MKTAIIISYLWLTVAIICFLLISVKGFIYIIPAAFAYFIHRLIKDAVIRIREGEK